MFEDIILPKNEDSGITWNKKCKDCNHGSFILSNYPGKVLCQSRRTHVDHNFYCDKWIKKEMTGK